MKKIKRLAFWHNPEKHNEHRWDGEIVYENDERTTLRNLHPEGYVDLLKNALKEAIDRAKERG